MEGDGRPRRFQVVFRGYDPKEVHQALTSLLEERELLRRRVKALEEKCAVYEEKWTGLVPGEARMPSEALDRLSGERRERLAEERAEMAREREEALLVRIQRLRKALMACQRLLEEALEAPEGLGAVHRARRS